jgi:DNA-directed RNA polymerase specialized sigma24 family protein
MEHLSESGDIDPKVIEDVYQTLLASLKTWARSWNKNRGDAEDIAHETIIRLLEHHRKTPIKSPMNWCRVTASSVMRETWRADKRVVSSDLSEAPEEARKTLQLSMMEMESPAALAEQRDFIQKIDPDWRVHLEEGANFSRGGKSNLDRNTRRRIQRRAMALLRED